jgi:ArsR family transcriptional regulator, cadmium/lead-responsive transcriptional repressor
VLVIEIDPALSMEAKLFRGLSDPKRLAVLKTLRNGELCVSDIVQATGLSQPNVSGYLACLRDCGLVASRQDGRSVFYSLADETMESIFLAAEDIIGRVARRLFHCANYRTESEAKPVGQLS